VESKNGLQSDDEMSSGGFTLAVALGSSEVAICNPKQLTDLSDAQNSLMVWKGISKGLEIEAIVHALIWKLAV
jgi:hypothetical protein